MYKAENPTKYYEKISNFKIKCKCGHTMLMPPHLDKMTCSWCKEYVFRTKKDEFLYKMKQKINRR